MSVESILAVTAASWGVVMGLSPLLQIRRMLRTRSSRDVSIGYLAVLNIGFLLWVCYGVSLPNVALAMPNVVAFAVGCATVGVTWRLRLPE
jgi:MtN3 and saliva related transmembrane protein